MNDKNEKNISRKDALKKIGNYGKYAALTALGTYMILHPKKARIHAQFWRIKKIDFWPGPTWNLESVDIFPGGPVRRFCT